MIKIALSGANGKMGQVISRCVAQREDCKIVAGFDLNTEVYSDFPIFKRVDDFIGEVDVIIDFSNPVVIEDLLEYAKRHNIPVVVATTGYAPEQVEYIKESAKKIPIFFPLICLWA